MSGSQTSAGLLSHDMTAGEAMVCLLDHWAQDFVDHLPLLMSTEDPEGTHHTRVALRRLRAVLHGFRPILKNSGIAPVKDEAKALFHRIGELRDAEILLQAIGGDDRTEALSAKRIALRAALRTQDADGFATRTHALLQGKAWRRKGRTARDWRKGPVKVLASRALDVASGTCAAYGPDIAELSPEMRHSFRKDLKTFRYLSEFFLPLWRLSPASAHLSTVKAMQDELGVLTDIAAMRRAVTPDATTRSEQDQKTAGALIAADILWHKLAAQEPWWR